MRPDVDTDHIVWIPEELRRPGVLCAAVRAMRPYSRTNAYVALLVIVNEAGWIRSPAFPSCSRVKAVFRAQSSRSRCHQGRSHIIILQRRFHHTMPPPTPSMRCSSSSA
jgi:hypothetical protein